MTNHEAVRQDRAASASGRGRASAGEVLTAVAAFAVLCVVVLGSAPRLCEPDDYAYRASIIAITRGHLQSLSTAQYEALATSLPGGPDRNGPAIAQWAQLPDGRWISEKDPGYSYLAVPFQLAGLRRLAPLFFGALGCWGLFVGARRWLCRYGGSVAVGLFCSSGAALLFAWRDYMATFIDASLIAAGSGALVWALLAVEVTSRRRTCVGLLAFMALEAAVFVRYSNVVVLGCACVVIVVIWWRRAAQLSTAMVGCWMGSVAAACLAVAAFNNAVYGGPLTPATHGFRGRSIFSLAALGPNLRNVPIHLVKTMPMFILGLAAIAWIIRRYARPDRTEDMGRDLGIACALLVSWLAVWGLYATFIWTANPNLSTLQVIRFYVPAIGAISLLGSWLIMQLARSTSRPAIVAVAVIAVLFGLGLASFESTHVWVLPGGRS